MKVLENLPLSKRHINSVSLNDESSCHRKRRHGFLLRPSEFLTAPSVVYRSQMGRGAGVKCIKCPLLSFMNGLKDLQSSVIRLSITATTCWYLRCWLQPWGMMSITSFVKSSSPQCQHLSAGKTIKRGEKKMVIPTAKSVDSVTFL